MGEGHSIQGNASAERNRISAQRSIGFYDRGEFGKIRIAMEGKGFREKVYEPGKVEDRYPKEGDFEVFDEHVAKRWDLVEQELQAAEHASRWVSKELPETLVVWEDFQAHGVGLVETANELGIPTVMITHGSVLGMKMGNFGNTTTAKYVCGTWALRQMYQDLGQEIEVIPTGLMEFDKLVNVDRDFLRVANRKDLGWDLDKPVLTWIGTWNGNRTTWQPDEQLYFSAFLQAFKTLREIEPSVQLNVCPHPNSLIPPEWYRSSLERVGINTKYRVLEQGTELWITGSDLLVGTVSSVMAFGTLMGIPSVIMDFKPWHEYTWYRYKGFEIVENVKELTSMLAQLFATTERYVRRKKETELGAQWFTSNTDGQAGKRVERVIERIASGKGIDEDCYAPIPEMNHG